MSDELLSRLLFRESKVVSYRFLCHTLDIPADEAKRLLQHFYATHEKDLTPLYIVSGQQADGTLVVRLVSATLLPSVERALSPLFSVHLYSLQRAIPSDSAVLYGADHELRVHVSKHSALRAETLQKREIRVPEKNAPHVATSSKPALPKKSSSSLSGFFTPKATTTASTKSGAPAEKKPLEKKEEAPKIDEEKGESLPQESKEKDTQTKKSEEGKEKKTATAAPPSASLSLDKFLKREKEVVVSVAEAKPSASKSAAEVKVSASKDAAASVAALLHDDADDEEDDDESSLDLAAADEMSSLDEADFALQVQVSDDEDDDWEFYRRSSRKKHRAYRRLRTKLKATQRRIEKELAAAYDSEDETSTLKKAELKRIKQRARELKAAQRQLEEERARRKAEARERRKAERAQEAAQQQSAEKAAAAAPKLAPSDRPLRQARPKKKAFEIDSADEISSSDSEAEKKLAEREKRKRKFGEYFSQGGTVEAVAKVAKVDEAVYKTVIEQVQVVDAKGYITFETVKKRVVDEEATRRQAEARAKAEAAVSVKREESKEKKESTEGKESKGAAKPQSRQGSLTAFFTAKK